jgi:hypothetical protein
MVEIEIKLHDERFKADLEALKSAIPDMNERAIGLAAEFVRGRVQKDYLMGPRPERLEVRSARLIQSIQSETERDGDDTKAYVGSNARSTGGFNYPAYWEYDGSKHGGPRPFLGPAVEENAEKWVDIWIKNLGKRIEAWLSARAS